MLWPGRSSWPWVYDCCTMYHYEMQTGTTSRQGFKSVTQNGTTQMCNDWWEAQEGAWYQTQYQCGGGYTGKCHSIPGGYYQGSVGNSRPSAEEG